MSVLGIKFKLLNGWESHLIGSSVLVLEMSARVGFQHIVLTSLDFLASSDSSGLHGSALGQTWALQVAAEILHLYLLHLQGASPETGCWLKPYSISWALAVPVGCTLGGLESLQSGLLHSGLLHWKEQSTRSRELRKGVVSPQSSTAHGWLSYGGAEVIQWVRHSTG